MYKRQLEGCLSLIKKGEIAKFKTPTSIFGLASPLPPQTSYVTPYTIVICSIETATYTLNQPYSECKTTRFVVSGGVKKKENTDISIPLNIGT